MRRFPFPALAAFLAFAGPAIADEIRTTTWTPRPLPAGCAAVAAHAVALDCSGSMRRDGLFDHAKEEVVAFLDQAPACTYAILACFGATADVFADGFLPDDRAALVAAVRRLRATHRVTNLDEAAKLLELVHYKLSSSYEGLPVTQQFKVLTDDVSAPDPGKPKFSLRQFVQRFAGSRVDVIELKLAPSGGATGRLSSDGVLVLPVRDLRAVLLRDGQAPAKIDAAPDPVPKAPAGAAALPLEPLAIAAALALLLVLIVLRRRRKADGAVIGIEPVGLAPAPTPVALIVTEREVRDDDGPDDARLLRQDVAVALAPDAPATFGVDVDGCSYVSAPIDGQPPGGFFTVTPTRGRLRLVAVSGASCDGKPVPQGGQTLSADRPFVVQVATRRWTIVPSFRTAGPAPADAFFAALRARRAAGRAARPEEPRHA